MPVIVTGPIFVHTSCYEEKYTNVSILYYSLTFHVLIILGKPFNTFFQI